MLKKSLIQPKQRNSTCMLSEYHKVQFDHRHSSINANKVRSCQLRLNKAVDSIRCVQSSVNKILWAEFFRFTTQQNDLGGEGAPFSFNKQILRKETFFFCNLICNYVKLRVNVNKNNRLSKSREHGQKSIWLIFCLWVAFSSKQTEMGLDY